MQTFLVLALTSTNILFNFFEKKIIQGYKGYICHHICKVLKLYRLIKLKLYICLGNFIMHMKRCNKSITYDMFLKWKQFIILTSFFKMMFGKKICLLHLF